MQTVQQSIFQADLSAAVTAGFAADFVLVCLAVISAVTDLWRGRVYNAVTVPGILAGLVFAAQRAGAPGILDVFCSVGFTALVLFPFYRAGGLGAGDIKLLSAVSAFMPAETYLRCFAASFAAGAVAGVCMLFFTKGKVHTIHFAVPVAASVLLHLAGVY